MQAVPVSKRTRDGAFREIEAAETAGLFPYANTSSSPWQLSFRQRHSSLNAAFSSDSASFDALILTKPPQDTSEHQIKLVSSKCAQLPDRPHVDRLKCLGPGMLPV